MAEQLSHSVKGNIEDEHILKRYVRIEEAAELMKLTNEQVAALALAAGARYKLPRITLIHIKKLEKYMKHIYRVPDTGKKVIKKYVRLGEGSIIYSIGRHRFVEMARAAGAIYKINDGPSGTILVNLDLFDEYMEQYHQAAIPLKTPLWNGNKEEV